MAAGRKCNSDLYGCLFLFLAALCCISAIGGETPRMQHLFHSMNVSRPTSNRIRRQSQGAPPVYHVDVLVVVDYNVFTKWFSRVTGSSLQEKTQVARREIRKYYTLVMAGVDLRYRNIGLGEFRMRIQTAGYVINDEPELYNWRRLRNQRSTSRDLLDADQALKDFRKWINTTSGLPEHDHAMLFTGSDLYTRGPTEDQRITHASGLAFIGTLCRPGDSVSVVEEQGGLQSVGPAAHELGHSLGARHDGEDNACSPDDRYIMAATGLGVVPPARRLNPWRFSPCSVDYFTQYIALLLAEESKCLIKSSAAGSANGTRYSGAPRPTTDPTPPPGQVYGPDEQCRQIWGPSSYLCRGAEFGNVSSVCTAMYCRDPDTPIDCVLHTAARGTSCGHHQWCVDGQCLNSRSAPAHPCIHHAFVTGTTGN